MNATDLDPNFLLPVWQAMVRYLRTYPPVVQAPQQLELPLPSGQLKACVQAAKQYLPKELERRLPLQPSP
ncbi:MAG TPA: hypothetical protein VGM47_02710 [Gammaproteobacteria bacterium]|jgi:hypothetical protein